VSHGGWVSHERKKERTVNFKNNFHISEKRQIVEKWKLIFHIKCGCWSAGWVLIDWCCFYYFLRNSLVALLEALFAQYSKSKSIQTVLFALVRNLKFFQFCQAIKHAKPFKQKQMWCDGICWGRFSFSSFFLFALGEDNNVWVVMLPEILRHVRKQDLEIYEFCW